MKEILDNTSSADCFHKPFLTLSESSKYFGIGQNSLRDFTDSHQEAVLWVGNKRLIKKTVLENILLQTPKICD